MRDEGEAEEAPTEAYKRYAAAQGEATEGNTVDNTLMVNQGPGERLDLLLPQC